MTQEEDASVAKVQQLLFKVQCIPILVEKAKKLQERVSILTTVVCSKLSKGS